MVSSIDVTAGRLSVCGARRKIRQTPLVLSAVALTAAMLGACAQSSTVADRRVSPAAVRQAPPQVADAAPARNVRIRRTAKTQPSKTQANNTQARPQGASDGMASFYSHGDKTASGERFNAGELTAAHRTLPFGTKVRVTNVTTGQSVTVRINDRGPFVNGRVIDVSHSAAQSLGMVSRGVAKVKLDVVD